MTNHEQTILLMKAVHFAAIKHTDQRRKGERQEPYFNHLADVALILAETTDRNDPILILGGLLHDTIEDTDTTYDELVAEFGTEIADLVQEVTDDTTLPRNDRKSLQIANAPHKSTRAKMLKIADKISNINSLTKSPPADWDDERKGEYLGWARQVVNGCRGSNSELERRFDDIINSF